MRQAALRLALGLLPSLLVAACGGNAPAVHQPATTAQARSVANEIGVQFPAAARVEHVAQIAGRDNAASVTLLLSEADWVALRARLVPATADIPPFSADANYLLGPDEGDWAPGRAQGLTTVQLPWRAGAEALNLGYAPAGKGRVRVFLFWHQL